MTRLTKTAGALVVAGLLLGGCGSSGESDAGATPTPSPTPTVMTKADAAARFLSLICPTNAALDELKATVSKVKQSDAEVGDPIPADALAASQAYADSALAQSEGLTDPLYIWPTEVQESITVLAKEAEARGEFYSTLATPKATFAPDPGLKDTTEQSQQVRKALGLPPPGKGCPAPSPTS